MIQPEPSFTLGIEEEYLLVDLDSRNVALDPPPEIFDECESEAGDSLVEHELLRSQLEVDTCVCQSVPEASADLGRLRRLTNEVAGRYGLAPIAASTHPFADWHKQRRTDRVRFQAIAKDMRTLSRRNLVCGMHVHVGIEDDDLRVELMNRFAVYLPLVLALSTSSPFWQGINTGLKSYRLTVFDGFPRTGLPERFNDFSDYQRTVAFLTNAGVISDASFIWWDMRISVRYPTLECRIADMCTRLDHAVSIAALIQSILHHLYRVHRYGDRDHGHPRLLIDQNRWFGMRYGCTGSLLDFNTACVVPVKDLLSDTVELVHRDAEQLGCAAELEKTLKIPQDGTSADMQIKRYMEAVRLGMPPKVALREVVDMLVAETVRGI